jgi:uncharacterized protein (TIGR00251 family)
MSWHRYDPARKCLILTLHVQPHARKSEVAGLYGDALKVRIAAPAADNLANAELIDFLSEALDVPKSSVSIRHGATARRKVIQISGGPDLGARLDQLK